MRSWLLGLLAAAAAASCVHAECKLSAVGQLSTVPGGGQPVVTGEVNGHPARFLFDTGSAITTMWRDQALKLGVALGNTRELEVYGVGGRAPVQSATVDNMKIGSTIIRNYTTFVIGTPSWRGLAMVLGNQFFLQTDIAFDLPENKILLLNEKGCTGPDLVYWNKPYSQAPYRGGDLTDGAFYITVYLNGQPVDAQIDSGAATTIVDENLAARLGGVAVPSSAPASQGGIGFKSIPVHAVRFKTFTLGDETIQNAAIQTGPLFTNIKVDETGTRLGSQYVNNIEPRMLLGADFLRAHQLLISRPHQMLYFSYMGGPVFDVTTPANRRKTDSSEAAASTAPPAKTP